MASAPCGISWDDADVRGELSRVTGAEGFQRLVHASWVEMLVLNFDFPRFGLCAGQRRDRHRNAAIARPTLSG